ncbi:putative phage integrase [Desulfuromonas soudanensis]|uniref:Putative phage integrase n=1 Tax=Desulfuromonas soudanensis TaxID=1603606 RepID=A0A0M4D0S7_9BACT|nr:tyrosine-type recombinase/integrase [Desulfuromonas soudanensis]ALC16221.1 putative phage integrase [Desulfuromonas soudanensis]
MRTLEFHSALAPQIRNFISLRQLSGTDYQSQALLLSYFDRFLVEEKFEASCITPQITDRYLLTLSHLAPRVQSNRFCVVQQLCRYLLRHDPLTYVPEPIRVIASQAAHQPYIYNQREIGALLAAAAELRPPGSLRPLTYRTLLGLLYSTGIRIGEALALNLENFLCAEERLYIVEGKFRKARWVPLSTTTCQALQQYLDRRLRIKPRSPDSPLLLNQRSRRLHHVTVNLTFRQLLRRCAIPHNEHAGPRIHDLRHTFAVHRLLAWYRDGQDVNARLPWLATYLGHVDIHSTQVYLRATPELTEEVARRFHDYYLQQIQTNGGQS